MFLKEDCWYAIRISGEMLSKIKFIAAYQIAQVSAITHYAPVERIESYGEHGKHKLIFAEKATRIDPIQLRGAAPLQSPRYTTLAKFKNAKAVTELWA